MGTVGIDELRASEYGYLDERGHVYLDYAGAGIAARSQLEAHAARLAANLYGNPHSDSSTSRAAGALVESARRAALDFVGASPDEYVAIFTPNATGACRLVGEAYAFDPRAPLVLTYDNHNSVNGIREYARSAGTPVRYVPSAGPDLRVAESAVVAAFARSRFRRRRGLFAYPAQSNFTGVQHPLELIDLAHEHGYDVLLDAAAFAPTNRLDLGSARPEFVCLSWYKIFGYPTGVGCLIARRDALARLRRPWFSGGTIRAVSVQGDWHEPADDESAFEDGTLNFLAIPDVEVGLRWIESIGIDVVRDRVRDLTGGLLRQLGDLRHGNGRPLARVYGPTTTDGRGGTVAFNILDRSGAIVDERLVATESAAAGISLRAGCFCNPGAGENALEISRARLRPGPFSRVTTIDQYLRILGLPTAGAIRVSFGVASNAADVARLMSFLQATYHDRTTGAADLAPRTRC